MRSLIIFVVVVWSSASIAQTGQTTTKPVPFPLQLEMRVPFEPTAFPTEAQMHLLYELHLTNFGTAPLYLNRIDVFDADAAGFKLISTFQGEQLKGVFQPVGSKTSAEEIAGLEIPGGRTVVAFTSIAFDRGSHVPDRLSHRVITAESFAEGAVIATHHTPLPVLGPPLEGPNWLAADGPSNDPDNHHRRGLLIVDGRPVISRRYAIDWKQTTDGVSFSGDPRDVRSYYAYGKAVFAVADGRVVAARDGLPNNIPGHNDAFHPAVPITLETVAGNTITINLGGGHFAYYLHLQPGSLRVKAGERVRRGQMLARVGCTGDAREPHLHFEVTDSPKLIAGEGLPYLIDHYSSVSASGGLNIRRERELPMNGNVVAFGEDRHR